MSSDTSIEQQSVQLYEKEVQDYLAANLTLLGIPDLKLVQTEYQVKFGRDSGRIDVLARDRNGNFVVIEVKRGVAGRGAVGQVQSYMGTILEEFPEHEVRGILVAAAIDDAGKAALSVTKNIEFYEFQTKFEFRPVALIKPNVQRNVYSGSAEYREGYWEPLGGTLTQGVINCENCKKKTRAIRLGSETLCGLCGRKSSIIEEST